MIKDIKVGEYFYCDFDFDNASDSYWVQIVESIDSIGYATTRSLYDNKTKCFSLNSIYSDRCVKVEDIRDFKVGDKVIYTGLGGSPLGVQEITDISCNSFISTINDIGDKNKFHLVSIYGNQVILVKVSSKVVEYENGVPLEWGNEV